MTDLPDPGDVIANEQNYVLAEWWAALLNDAMSEDRRQPSGDLNPVFGYLVVLDVLNLTDFFESVKADAVQEGLMNGELTIESHGEIGLRIGDSYTVEIVLEAVEQKEGATLGQFELVTITGTIRGKESDCRYSVTNKIIFTEGGAYADTDIETSSFDPNGSIPSVEINRIEPCDAKLVVALTRDPSPLHWDVSSVERLELGDTPLNPGSNNLAYLLQMIGDWSGGYGDIRDVQVRFTGLIFVGDRVVGQADLIDPAEERSDGETTLVIELLRKTETGYLSTVEGEATVGPSTGGE